MKLIPNFSLENLLQALLILGSILIAVKYHSYVAGVIAFILSQVVLVDY